MRTFPSIAVALTLATTVAIPASVASAATSTSKSDTAAITALAQAADTGANVATTCKTRFTAAFAKKLYGSVTKCAKSGDGDGTGAKVKSVKVSGSSATAKVTDVGGQTAGATGTWHFTKSKGKWLVSDFGVDYLRSQASTTFGSSYKSSGANDPFGNSVYRKCINSHLKALSDSAFRKVVYSGNTGNNAPLAAVLAGCTKSAPGKMSPFRTLFESELRSDTAGQVPDDVLTCVIEKINSSVSDTALITALLDGSGSSSFKKFDAQVGQFVTTCSKGASKAGAFHAPAHAIAPRRPLR